MLFASFFWLASVFATLIFIQISVAVIWIKKSIGTTYRKIP